MRVSPSIVPDDVQGTYLVLDDFGRNGRAWREADLEDTPSEDNVITDLLNPNIKIRCGRLAPTLGRAGRKTCPPTVARDCAGGATRMRDVPFFLREFVDRYERRKTVFARAMPHKGLQRSC